MYGQGQTSPSAPPFALFRRGSGDSPEVMERYAYHQHTEQRLDPRPDGAFLNSREVASPASSCSGEVNMSLSSSLPYQPQDYRQTSPHANPRLQDVYYPRNVHPLSVNPGYPYAYGSQSRTDRPVVQNQIYDPYRTLTSGDPRTRTDPRFLYQHPPQPVYSYFDPYDPNYPRPIENHYNPNVHHQAQYSYSYPRPMEEPYFSTQSCPSRLTDRPTPLSRNRISSRRTQASPDRPDDSSRRVSPASSILDSENETDPKQLLNPLQTYPRQNNNAIVYDLIDLDSDPVKPSWTVEKQTISNQRNVDFVERKERNPRPETLVTQTKQWNPESLRRNSPFQPVRPEPSHTRPVPILKPTQLFVSPETNPRPESLASGEPQTPSNQMITLMSMLVNSKLQSDKVLTDLVKQKQSSVMLLPDLNQRVKSFSGDEPSSEAKAWLRAYKRLAELYTWDERFKLDNARAHLEGAAQKWFRRLDLKPSTRLDSWHKFESAFKASFCSHYSKSESWTKMKARSQGREETAFHYFQDKAMLCEECGLDFSDSKREVILGLSDRGLANHLDAKSHTDLNQMEKDIRDRMSLDSERKLSTHHVQVGREKPLDSQPKDVRVTPSRDQNENASSSYKKYDPGNETKSIDPNPKENLVYLPQGKNPLPRYNDKNEPLCYSCHEYGHKIADCKFKRTMFCEICKKSDHTKRHCPSNPWNPNRKLPENPKNVEVVHTVENSSVKTLSMYLKAVKVNQNDTVTGLIDTGSSCCTMRECCAKKLQLESEKSNSKLLGFGSRELNGLDPIGSCHVTLEIDGVEGECEVFVVPDTAQGYDLMVGSSWLNLPHVMLIKTGQTCLIGNMDNEPFKSLRKASLDTIVNSAETLVKTYSVNRIEVVTESSNVPNKPLTLATSENKTQRKSYPRVKFKWTAETVKENINSRSPKGKPPSRVDKRVNRGTNSPVPSSKMSSLTINHVNQSQVKPARLISNQEKLPSNKKIKTRMKTQDRRKESCYLQQKA